MANWGLRYVKELEGYSRIRSHPHFSLYMWWDSLLFLILLHCTWTCRLCFWSCSTNRDPKLGPNPNWDPYLNGKWKPYCANSDELAFGEQRNRVWGLLPPLFPSEYSCSRLGPWYQQMSGAPWGTVAGAAHICSCSRLGQSSSKYQEPLEAQLPLQWTPGTISNSRSSHALSELCLLDLPAHQGFLLQELKRSSNFETKICILYTHYI